MVEQLSTSSQFTFRCELLRAIDVRLETLTQNLSTACGRAVAAGYDHK
ncbi:hypothetical protein HanPSC8_Chr09g0404011 [Helianthus annuus]|nr:hypothetical protein HanPSC8_Chr09g0404011 [Helianthus annuus]